MGLRAAPRMDAAKASHWRFQPSAQTNATPWFRYHTPSPRGECVATTGSHAGKTSQCVRVHQPAAEAERKFADKQRGLAQGDTATKSTAVAVESAPPLAAEAAPKEVSTANTTNPAAAPKDVSAANTSTPAAAESAAPASTAAALLTVSAPESADAAPTAMYWSEEELRAAQAAEEYYRQAYYNYYMYYAAYNGYGGYGSPEADVSAAQPEVAAEPEATPVRVASAEFDVAVSDVAEADQVEADPAAAAAAVSDEAKRLQRVQQMTADAWQSLE